MPVAPTTTTNTTEPHKTLPAAYYRATELFEAMQAHTNGDHDPPRYEGFLTRLAMQQLQFTSPTYSYALRALQAMGCISQLRRGAGPSPSLWELHTPPTPDLYHTNITNTPKQQSQLDRVEALLKQIQEQLEKANL